MKDFVPSWNSILLLLVAALVGYCLLLRGELEHARGENELLVQKTVETEHLRAQVSLLQNFPELGKIGRWGSQ